MLIIHFYVRTDKMRFIYADYNPQTNSIDITTFENYILRIDCNKAVSGYQVDHYENGIMAINKNSSTPNAMDDFLANNKYISDDMINKYVTNNTQHG